jgi:hypothetical protein
MTDITKTLAALDDLEQQQRDEARRNTQASRESTTPEQRQHDAARWLADQLQANTSRWTTLSA